MNTGQKLGTRQVKSTPSADEGSEMKVVLLTGCLVFHDQHTRTKCEFKLIMAQTLWVRIAVSL